jgi:hypothetical protein
LKVEKRNDDFRRIYNRLVLNEPEVSTSEVGCMGAPKLSSTKKLPKNPVIKKNMVAAHSDEFDKKDLESSINTLQDAVIWLGDLNYRINGVIGSVVHAMQMDMFEVLLGND